MALIVLPDPLPLSRPPSVPFSVRRDDAREEGKRRGPSGLQRRSGKVGQAPEESLHAAFYDLRGPPACSSRAGLWRKNVQSRGRKVPPPPAAPFGATVFAERGVCAYCGARDMALLWRPVQALLEPMLAAALRGPRILMALARTGTMRS